MSDTDAERKQKLFDAAVAEARALFDSGQLDPDAEPEDERFAMVDGLPIQLVVFLNFLAKLSSKITIEQKAKVIITSSREMVRALNADRKELASAMEAQVKLNKEAVAVAAKDAH